MWWGRNLQASCFCICSILRTGFAELYISKPLTAARGRYLNTIGDALVVWLEATWWSMNSRPPLENHLAVSLYRMQQSVTLFGWSCIFPIFCGWTTKILTTTIKKKKKRKKTSWKQIPQEHSQMQIIHRYDKI